MLSQAGAHLQAEAWGQALGWGLPAAIQHKPHKQHISCRFKWKLRLTSRLQTSLLLP